MTTLHDFTARTPSGEDRALSDYADKVAVVVNTASQCGLTPQFGLLQEIFAEYRDQGLVVLGFPCNQFAGQEPGTDAEASEFCQVNYGVEFPMFAKIEVNGEGAHPLYDWLKQEAAGEDGAPGEDIEWNFAKFLVGRDGRVIQRFSSKSDPGEMVPAIESALAAS